MFHARCPRRFRSPLFFFFFFNDTATTEIYTLSLHDALPIWFSAGVPAPARSASVFFTTLYLPPAASTARRSEEHTSELQSRLHLVCRLLLEKKNKQRERMRTTYRANLASHPTCTTDLVTTLS